MHLLHISHRVEDNMILTPTNTENYGREEIHKTLVQMADVAVPANEGDVLWRHATLIYGIGHAVYTISDPRAVVLKELARDLAKEKGREEEFAFLELLESRAIECFAKHKGTKKRVSSNVDFYSGFVYEMIGLPQEIYTPLFAMARIVGWTAHRIEELNFDGKRIIRPAYKNVLEEQSYLPIADR